MVPSFVEPAGEYAPADDLAIVTCHFNPSGYASKLAKFTRFREPIIKSGLDLFIIECTFAGRSPELPRDWNAKVISARDVLWQKERLLNILVGELPKRFKKVVWLDADLLFAERDWAVRVSEALNSESIVVQPFELAIRLPPKRDTFEGIGELYKSFASIYLESPNCLLRGRYPEHGHTGFGWAARREIVEEGLYDACISGSGDHVMAHAFCGDWESDCITRTFGTDTAMLTHFQSWAEHIYPRVRARVGFIPGTILHLWHGDMANRRYALRNQELIAMRFDPYRHLEARSRECWQLTDVATDFRTWALEYFQHRREDTYRTLQQVATGTSGL